jgi:succinoglycan biosynthesis protein ExoV
MQLVYFRGRQPNFGDDLNAVLWPRLLPRLFTGTGPDGFLGIGTLIGMKAPGCIRLHVFSTGAGYQAIETWRIERRIWCVRGPLTARLLGVEPDVALTDGAILALDVLDGSSADSSNGQTVGVVPHWESLHFPGWQEACDTAGFRLITPVDTPANVHAAIGSVSLVLTESLHGAILADAMGIPWVPFITTRNVSALKWVDWCLSVGVTFSPVPISPPSAAAALAFGRPARDGNAERLRFDAESAMREFRERVAMQQNAPSSPGLTARARAGLQAASGQSKLISRALGYSPARTAAGLAAAARLEPTLSAASLRTNLRAQMLERLRAFERAHTSHLNASAEV